MVLEGRYIAGGRLGLDTDRKSLTRPVSYDRPPASGPNFLSDGDESRSLPDLRSPVPTNSTCTDAPPFVGDSTEGRSTAEPPNQREPLPCPNRSASSPPIHSSGCPRVSASGSFASQASPPLLAFPATRWERFSCHCPQPPLPSLSHRSFISNPELSPSDFSSSIPPSYPPIHRL